MGLGLGWAGNGLLADVLFEQNDGPFTALAGIDLLPDDVLEVALLISVRLAREGDEDLLELEAAAPDRSAAEHVMSVPSSLPSFSFLARPDCLPFPIMVRRKGERAGELRTRLSFPDFGVKVQTNVTTPCAIVDGLASLAGEREKCEVVIDILSVSRSSWICISAFRSCCCKLRH